jgi:hypothetical protein
MALPNFDSEDFRTPSQTDSSRERGWTDDEPADLGRSESEAEEDGDVGDIADETPGHRG